MKNITLTYTDSKFPAVKLFNASSIMELNESFQILRNSIYSLSDKPRVIEPFSSLSLYVQKTSEIVVNMIKLNFSAEDCSFSVVKNGGAISSELGDGRKVAITTSGQAIVPSAGESDKIMTITNYSSEIVYMIKTDDTSYGENTTFLTFLMVNRHPTDYFLPVKSDLLRDIIMDYYSSPDSNYDVIIRKKSAQNELNC